MDLSPHIVGEMVETTLNMGMLTTDGSEALITRSSKSILMCSGSQLNPNFSHFSLTAVKSSSYTFCDWPFRKACTHATEVPQEEHGKYTIGRKFLVLKQKFHP